MKKFSLIFTWLIFMGYIGCRGYSSQEPPIHVNPNMDTQEKGKPYRASDFFKNGQYMQMPIEGTVARGELKQDEHFYHGKIDDKPAKTLPANLTIDEAFLRRGQVMFNRTCAACHSYTGDGDGLVGRRLLVKPRSFHIDSMQDSPPGHFFDVITNGFATMPSLGYMIKEEDRWAIVAYIRSLQMSQDIDRKNWVERSTSWWVQAHEAEQQR